MIKSLVAFSWLDKLFPTQASYTELTTSQQQRLKIIWSSVAILLALLVFLALLFVLNTPTPATTPIKNVVQTATYQSTTPGQTLEFKAPTPLNAQLDPNFTVVSGKVESDANYITFSMQIAGQLVTNGSINQVYQVGIDTELAVFPLADFSDEFIFAVVYRRFSLLSPAALALIGLMR